jgi:CDP-diacylglycerol--glycerol-3-phosphate 3-phosphatidyltransferase
MFHSIANKLTISRIIFTPIILLLLAVPHAWAAWVALILFAIAGLTDYLDGYMARRENDITAIGQFLDPIADNAGF